MQQQSFKVKYLSVNTCFLYLPEYWLKKVLTRSNVVKMLHNAVNYYLSWYTRPCPDNTNLCLSATFARTLNIKEGDEVFVSCVEEAPSLTSLIVAPKSLHDREIVEMQIENIQSNLLNQISIVSKNQTIVFWVSKLMSVTLVVNSLDPEFTYGRLQALTQVYVGNAVGKIQKETCDIFSDLLVLLRFSDVYRVHPLLTSIADEVLHLPFRAYMQSSTANDEETKLFKVHKIREDRQESKLSDLKSVRLDDSQSIVIEVCPLRDLYKCSKKPNEYNYSNFTRHLCVYMTFDLMNTLRIKVGGRIILEAIDGENKNNAECAAIEIYSQNRWITEEDFCTFIRCNSKNSKILLNSHGILSLNDDTRCLVKLLPDSCYYDFFNEISLMKLKIKVNNTCIEDNPPSNNIEDIDLVNENIKIDVLQTVITECINRLKLSLGLHEFTNIEYDRENILINGSAGSGKTSICKLLRNIFGKQPYFIYTKIIDCKSLKGKNADIIHKLLAAEIFYAVYYQPTILFFDNIDCITSANIFTEERTPDSMNALRIIDVIYNIIMEYQVKNYISVVATCTNSSKLGKKLRVARGIHFFRTILMISNLTKEERINILRLSLQNKLHIDEEIDWNHYGNKTEGWVAQDLVALVNKTVFTVLKRHVKDRNEVHLTLKDSELSESLLQCRQNSLHGVKLYRGSGHGWSHIGGLADVKRAITEILYWPLKYPKIFHGAPIKLQNGILLYGMPGTGKTLLAGALAHEFNFNMISVKGPELLSKYIGASEEAVRNIFEKAQRAKPCVLFFDEFDSLAPRRGHDSTGVTDRVVNQLLTHLDGIEDREGVAVVAASSRPDLLDPALLRPGRLDKSLLCPLPNEQEREEILSTICEAHKIDAEDLDFKSLASLTSDFSGADLNAALMQARLNVIEEALKISSEETKGYCEKKISQKHLIESINLMKPSILSIEKEKYKKIYAKFAKNDNYPSEELKNQKATLA